MYTPLPKPAIVEPIVKVKTSAELSHHKFIYGEMDSIHEAVNIYLHLWTSKK